MGTMNILNLQESSIRFDSLEFFSPELSAEYVELQSNYHLARSSDDWVLPMAQYNCSNNNFTTSPASTATHQTFLSQDGHNPFDISFGEVACSGFDQQLPFGISSSQNLTYTSHIACTPRTMAKPYSAAPTQSATSLASSRKRRRNSEGVTQQSTLGSLPLRGSDAKSPKNPRGQNRDPRKVISSDTSTILKTSPDTLIAGEEDIKAKGNIRMLAKEKERHKIVEMKYRKQMQDRFDELLLALPSQAGTEGTSGVASHQKKIRRGKVLDLAKEHIEMLERQNNDLLRAQDLLRGEVKVYEDSWFGRIDVPGPMG